MRRIAAAVALTACIPLLHVAPRAFARAAGPTPTIDELIVLP